VSEIVIDLELAMGMRARVTRFRLMHAPFESQLATHHRHHRFITIGADSHFDLVREVDAVDEFQKAMDEVLAGHFAVADDVDPGILLPFDRKQRCIELGRGQFIALLPPLGPQLVRLGEPGWFWQAAGDGRRKHHA
jgi:hypothetical protein